ncbi:hypothetical protein RU639_013514 [Aspergillus parasiticus]
MMKTWACYPCYLRKTKCTDTRPCSQCTEHGIECTPQQRILACTECGGQFKSSERWPDSRCVTTGMKCHYRKRVMRACYECSKRKTKCSEQIPCDQCMMRGMQCQPVYRQENENITRNAPGLSLAEDQLFGARSPTVTTLDDASRFPKPTPCEVIDLDEESLVWSPGSDRDSLQITSCSPRPKINPEQGNNCYGPDKCDSIGNATSISYQLTDLNEEPPLRSTCTPCNSQLSINSEQGNPSSGRNADTVDNTQYQPATDFLKEAPPQRATMEPNYSDIQVTTLFLNLILPRIPPDLFWCKPDLQNYLASWVGLEGVLMPDKDTLQPLASFLLCSTEPVSFILGLGVTMVLSRQKLSSSPKHLAQPVYAQALHSIVTKNIQCDEQIIFFITACAAKEALYFKAAENKEMTILQRFFSKVILIDTFPLESTSELCRYASLRCQGVDHKLSMRRVFPASINIWLSLHDIEALATLALTIEAPIPPDIGHALGNRFPLTIDHFDMLLRDLRAESSPNQNGFIVDQVFMLYRQMAMVLHGLEKALSAREPSLFYQSTDILRQSSGDVIAFMERTVNPWFSSESTDKGNLLISVAINQFCEPGIVGHGRKSYARCPESGRD